MRDDATAARAECGANRELAVTPVGANEEKVRDVRAGHEQHEQSGGGDDPQRLRYIADDVVAHRARVADAASPGPCSSCVVMPGATSANMSTMRGSTEAKSRCAACHRHAGLQSRDRRVVEATRKLGSFGSSCCGTQIFVPPFGNLKLDGITPTISVGRSKTRTSYR